MSNKEQLNGGTDFGIYSLCPEKIDDNGKQKNKKSVNIKNVLIVVRNNGYYIIPDRLGITKEKIFGYVKEHPMPEDKVYSLSDLISDLTETSPYRLYILPFSIKEATKTYIIELIDELRDDITHDIWKV